MSWITGIGRNGHGHLCVQTQSLDGNRALTELSAVSADLGIQGGLRRTVVFAFEDLRQSATASPAETSANSPDSTGSGTRIGGPTSTRGYLDAIGLPMHDDQGQTVYEVETEAGVLVIPTQLLVLATLGSVHQCRRVLLRPFGPTYLMSAFPPQRPGSLIVLPTPHRMQTLQMEGPSIAPKLEWVLSYPSATAAWGSVYRNALDGRFDMMMPRAEVTACIWAQRIGKKLFVTRLKVMKVTPTEEPHPFAADSAKHSFVFNSSLNTRQTHGKAAAPTGDTRVANIGGNCGSGAAGCTGGAVLPMTDAQWLALEQVMTGITTPAMARRHTVRAVLDVIFLKLGTPYPWTKVPADKRLVNSASVLLSKLKRLGVWDAVIAAATGGSS